MNECQTKQFLNWVTAQSMQSVLDWKAMSKYHSLFITHHNQIWNWLLTKELVEIMLLAGTICKPMQRWKKCWLMMSSLIFNKRNGENDADSLVAQLSRSIHYLVEWIALANKILMSSFMDEIVRQRWHIRRTRRMLFGYYYHFQSDK